LSREWAKKANNSWGAKIPSAREIKQYYTIELLSQLTYLLDYGSDLAFKDDNSAQFDVVSALLTSMGAEVTNKISQLVLNNMVMCDTSYPHDHRSIVSQHDLSITLPHVDFGLRQSLFMYTPQVISFRVFDTTRWSPAF